MDPGGSLWSRVLVVVTVCVCVVVVGGEPIGTSTINCNEGSDMKLGPVDEGYVGDVELVDGIAEGITVKLVQYIYPSHLQFLELSFTPGDSTATVRTKEPLDADVLANSDTTLYYSVMCDGAGVIKYNNTRTLKLRDINDNSPVFKQKSYNTTVSETQEVDTEVLRVTAVDADSTEANNRLTYSIEPMSQDFAVTNSGAFMLKRRLNYNLLHQYNFIVTAQDNGGLNDTASVQIDVADYDNLNPYFSHNQYQAFILENQVGSFRNIQPEAIKAQDGDTGINMTLTYSISSVSPEQYKKNFNMDPGSGVVGVVTAFDREEMKSGVVFVGIKAAQTDDPLKTADALVLVTVEDVNDNPPKFDESNYSVELPENSPVDAILFRAVVTDLDQGGFVGTLQIKPESVPFSIGSDGTVRVKDSTALDRETTDEFTFHIEAAEADPPNAVSMAPVIVTLLDENDNSPSFSSSTYKGKVTADQFVGAFIIQVEAEDPDAGVNGQIKYSIDFGNDDGFFSMDEATGEISLAKLIPLVENRILEFHLYVTARDGGTVSRSSSAQVTIRAPGDSKPQFLQKQYNGTVEEGREPGFVITRVNFLAMAEVPITLEVKTEAEKFAISSNGEFTTKVELDFDEGPHSYSVQISISDGVNSDEAVVEVQVTDVNDNSPVFDPDSFMETVPEDAEVGSNVTEVSATDKDSGFNKEIRYSLRGGEGRFFVDPLSGMVSVAAALDRETKAQYNLLVVAEDQGRPARSSTANLLVQVSDVNDNAPVFSEALYQLDLIETEPVDTNLLTLSAVDPDEGANGTVTYRITNIIPRSDPPYFTLDAVNGNLILARPLNCSVTSQFKIKVAANDWGTPPLVGQSIVQVYVEDTNNNPPEFDKESYDVAVPENLASGTTFLIMEVVDRDNIGFAFGYFIYTSDTFDINRQGMVSLKKDVSLDRETKDRYIFQVMAVDQATDGLTATAQINITVLDYNDNTPQFPIIPDPLEIPEGNYTEENPGEIFFIKPTDADIGLNGEVTLTLISPQPLFRLTEDGMLLAVGDLDRETRETYELVLQASDKGNPQRENFTTVTVRLIDVNDHRPEFSSGVYVANIVVKDAEEGKLVLTVSAFDRDAGNNSLITYSVVAGASPHLALNSETGDVTLTSDLADLKQDTTENMTVEATDHGRPPLSSTASVIVNLEMASLVKGVTFQSSSYNFSLPENQQAGATVGRVRASAGSVIYDVAYELKTNTDLFSIDAGGAIVTKGPLDREKQEWYFLDVEAVDTRTPPTSATAAVRVQVDDVNEPPQFPPEVYKASVFSVAPYKTPVAHVKASDPDVGDQGQLVYSLSAGSPHFDVDPSSGLVYVVSAAGLAGRTTVVEVKASDPQQLYATARVEVSVQGSSSSDVVIISLNQPANVVEKNVPDLQKTLGAALGWTVNVIDVSSSSEGAADSRWLRSAERTLVSFITLHDGAAVSADDVTKKLRGQADIIRAELSQLFGEGTDFDIQLKPESSQAAVVALGVLLGLSVLGLVVSSGLFVWFKRKDKHKDSEEESFGISMSDDSDMNHQPISTDKKEGQMSSVDKQRDAGAAKTDDDKNLNSHV